MTDARCSFDSGWPSRLSRESIGIRSVQMPRVRKRKEKASHPCEAFQGPDATSHPRPWKQAYTDHLLSCNKKSEHLLIHKAFGCTIKMKVTWPGAHKLIKHSFLWNRKVFREPFFFLPQVIGRMHIHATRLRAHGAKYLASVIDSYDIRMMQIS